MLHVILAVAILVFAYYMWDLLARPSKYYLHYHGSFFDANLTQFTAGLNYAHCGFIQLKLMPAIHRFQRNCEYTPADFYGHFPPGPYLMSGVYQLIGLHRLQAQKVLLSGLSAGSLVFLVLSLAKIVASFSPQGRQIAIWTVPAIAVSSPWFIYWTNSLGEYSYRDFFMFLGLWLLLTNRLRGFAVASFLLALFSYEVVPMMFLIGCAKIAFDLHDGQLTKKQAGSFVLLFFLAPTTAIGLHFLQNAWFLGGIGKALEDYIHIGRYRAGIGGSGGYSVGMHVVKQLYATLWNFGSALLILATIGTTVCVRSRKLWPVALLVAGLVWQILMRQFCAVHAFAVRPLGLGIVALGVVGLVHLLEAEGKIQNWLGCGLLWLCVLRLPLGGEFSKNPLLLKGWDAAVAKTDTATLAQLLYDGRATSEHRDEKIAVVKELARRAALPLDEPAYEFTYGLKIFVLQKVQDQVARAQIPAELLPRFRQEPSPYIDETTFESQSQLPTIESSANDIVKPVRIEVNGTPNRWRLLMLNVFFRFI
jgi:uncharacterized membrane protein (UPF0136 family)